MYCEKIDRTMLRVNGAVGVGVALLVLMACG